MSENTIAETEEWRPVKGFEGLYSVSNLGRIFGHKRNWTTDRIIKLKPQKNGYVRFGMSRNGKRTYASVHRLVLIAFVGIDPDRPQTNHKDGIKSNNQLSNLEWCTGSENIQHSFRILGRIGMRGEHSTSAKITLEQVKEMWKLRLAGESTPSIGRKFGIQGGSVGQILRKTNWKHYTQDLPDIPQRPFQYIDDDQVICMRAMYSSGMNMREISRYFHISHSGVHRIVHFQNHLITDG